MRDTLNTYATVIHAQNAMKGFWDDEKNITTILYYDDKERGTNNLKAVEHAFKAQKLALITSEISEALEADRKDLMDDKLPMRKGLEVELADALIRILDMAGGYGMDIGGAVEEKLVYNKTRPFKHGKAY